MKKILSLLLCLVMVLAAFGGCAAGDPAESTAAESTAGEILQSLKVGYGRADITPQTSVPLGGRHGTVISDRVLDPLYATCIAFTDETDNTFLLFHLDLLQSYGEANLAKLKIAKELGINGEQIMMCSTHNHSGPNLNEITDGNIELYCKELPGQLMQAAKDAMEDRKPVTGAYITKTYPEGLNFCRHHILADGSYTGWATPATKSAVDHLRDADNELQLIKFPRDGGKDVVLMNWQGHPNAASYDSTAIASDVDAIRREIEPQLDCHFAYFLGASGNVNSQSYVKSELQSDWYIKDYITRTKKLVEYAVKAAENFEKVETDSVQFNSGKQPIGYRTGTGTIDVPVTSFSIGDIALTFAPYEMFTECGQKIKADSPFKMTFVSTCSNGSMSYIPSAYSYEYSAYESDNTKYAPGSAETLVDFHVSLLKQLHDAQ